MERGHRRASFRGTLTALDPSLVELASGIARNCHLGNIVHRPVAFWCSIIVKNVVSILWIQISYKEIHILMAYLHRRIHACTSHSRRSWWTCRKCRYRGRLWSQLARKAFEIRPASTPFDGWGRRPASCLHSPALARPWGWICPQGSSR